MQIEKYSVCLQTNKVHGDLLLFFTHILVLLPEGFRNCGITSFKLYRCSVSSLLGFHQQNIAF